MMSVYYPEGVTFSLGPVTKEMQELYPYARWQLAPGVAVLDAGIGEAKHITGVSPFDKQDLIIGELSVMEIQYLAGVL